MDVQSEYNENLKLNLNNFEAYLAVPKRPQDRINLSSVSQNFGQLLTEKYREVKVNKHNLSLLMETLL